MRAPQNVLNKTEHVKLFWPTSTELLN